MKQCGVGIVGDQLYLERFVWFDNEARRERFPNATGLGAHFKIAPKTAQRSIDHFRDRLQAPLEYDQSRKGYYYTDTDWARSVNKGCRRNCKNFGRWYPPTQ